MYLLDFEQNAVLFSFLLSITMLGFPAFRQCDCSSSAALAIDRLNCCPVCPESIRVGIYIYIQSCLCDQPAQKDGSTQFHGPCGPSEQIQSSVTPNILKYCSRE